MQNVLASIVGSMQEVPECLAPDVQSHSTAKVRMLLNKLVSELPSDEAYFEIGCLKGGTLISALLGNRHATAYACDNWSEYLHENPEKQFWNNLKRYRGRIAEPKVIKDDCWNLVKNPPFEKPVGIYFYDGDHSFESQERALTVFAKYLAERCIVLVDDWNWDDVKAGTWAGIAKIKPKHLFYLELPSRHNGDLENYHNGIGAFYLEMGENKFFTPSTAPGTITAGK